MTAVAAPARPARDAWVDVIRGVALLLIFLGHATLVTRALGDIGLVRLYLLIDLQVADAADFFVFLSGYVYGLVYARRLLEGGLSRVALLTAKRLLQIYAALIIAFAAGLLLPQLLPSVDEIWLRETRLIVVQADAGYYLWRLLSLMRGPFFLDILVLYVALLAAAPLVLLGMMRAPAATLALSVLLWGVAQFATLADLTDWLNAEHFDPLAWQLLFNIGLFAGTRGLLARRAPGGLAQALRHPATLAAVLAVGLAFALRMALRFAQQGMVDPGMAAAILAMPGWNKPTLGPIRVLNFAGLLYLAFAFAPLPGWRPRAWLARGMAALGERSLEMFCAGCIALLVVAWAVHVLGGGVGAYFAVMAVAAVLYVGAALGLQGFTRALAPPKPKPATDPARASQHDPARKLAKVAP
jgi:hypothetical protein